MTASVPKTTLLDDVVAFLRKHPEGVAANELAGTFLKLKNAPGPVAEGAIRAILAKDRRVVVGEDGLWRAILSGGSLDEDIQRLPWTAVYCFTDPLSSRLLYFSAWELFPAPICTHAAWLVDPQGLPFDEAELLTGGTAEYVPADQGGPAVAAFARDAALRLPLFLTSRHRDLFAAVCADNGETLPDDTTIVRELLKAAECPVPRSLDLPLFEKAVFGIEQSGVSVGKLGERFAAAAFELFGLLKRNGIETRAALDKCQSREKTFLFTGKKFSYDDILALPPLPGVYAFTDASGGYCYIGKANNLKRRLQSYWKESDESPGKLEQLRERAQGFITHRCGSELECLLYEYRLIKKYAPLLNKKTDIIERKGTWRPVNDCIVLLPHSEAGKGMSVWFRENQKILLKPFDVAFPDGNVLIAELGAFFFTPVLPAASADFPEQEIATRWIKHHADALTIIPVGRMANAEELYESLKSSWREFSG
jgi:hypothetical protein